MVKKSINKFLSLAPQTVFLIDAIGALLTCIVLSLVLPVFSAEFGIEKSVFYGLASVVACYFIYSISVYLLQPGEWTIFLRIIACANLIYCLITITLVISLMNQISTLGILYFAGEALIILTLAYLEFTYTYKAKALEVSNETL